MWKVPFFKLGRSNRWCPARLTLGSTAISDLCKSLARSYISYVNMFADIAKIIHEVRTRTNCKMFYTDLKKMQQWSDKRLIKLNIMKKGNGVRRQDCDNYLGWNKLQESFPERMWTSHWKIIWGGSWEMQTIFQSVAKMPPRPWSERCFSKCIYHVYLTQTATAWSPYFTFLSRAPSYRTPPYLRRDLKKLKIVQRNVKKIGLRRQTETSEIDWMKWVLKRGGSPQSTDNEGKEGKGRQDNYP